MHQKRDKEDNNNKKRNNEIQQIKYKRTGLKQYQQCVEWGSMHETFRYELRKILRNYDLHSKAIIGKIKT